MKCLNCGTECDGKFCPSCGQSTSTTRTTWKSFSISSLADMLRFKGRFLHTCGELLIHPWSVISNYTAGRRVRYSSPLLFLLTLAIYSTLLYSWADLDDNVEHNLYILRFYEFSSGMFTLCMLPPIIFALRLVYKRYGLTHYNVPELFTAGIFLSALSFILDILLLPISMLVGDTVEISLIVFLVYSSICILKAFPVRPRWKGILLFIWFLILGVIFLSFYMLTLELIPQLILGSSQEIHTMHV